MKKHQFEALLEKIVDTEEMPGWQDALHQMIVEELAAVKRDRAARSVPQKKRAGN